MKNFLILGASLFLVLATSCTPKEAQAPTKEKMVIGTWVLESLKIGEQEFPASVMGGEVSFKFNTDGSVELATPDGGSETAKYFIKDDAIIIDDGTVDIESDEAKMKIKSLDKAQMIVTVDVDGQSADLKLNKKS